MRYAALILPLLLIAVAYGLDLAKILGAHPWWSRDVVLYGALGGGSLAGGVLWLSARPAAWALGFWALAGGGVSVATWGKTQFVASYAEDALAGQLWFFGWIAACLFAVAAATMTGAALARVRLSR
ncbi:MAG: hypothetical protein ACPGFC_02430 [Paracoccaceae bacterium]